MKVQKTFMALAVLLGCTTICTSCNTSSGGMFGKQIKGSNTYVTKEIKVEDFTKIHVMGSPDIVYTQQSGKPKVEIFTSDNIVDLIEISVKGGTLRIGQKKGVNISCNKLEVRVTSPTLAALAISGSSDVLLKNGVQTDNLALSISGSGDIEGNGIRCNGLTLSISGSGDIKLKGIEANHTSASVTGSGDIGLSGTTEEADYSVTGSGDIDADDLVAKSVAAGITGSGDIKCHATDNLSARITGSGEIGYKGNPAIEGSQKGLYRLQD